MKQEREQHHENLGWGMTMNWCNEAEKKSKTGEIPPPTKR